MSEEIEKPDTASTRRVVLRFGAASIPAFATVKASATATAASILTCHLPLTMTQTTSKWIDSSGALVASGTANSYGPLTNSPGYYTGEEVKTYATTGNIPSGKYYVTSSGSAPLNSTVMSAHANYMLKLTNTPGSGYTCLVSVQQALTH